MIVPTNHNTVQYKPLSLLGFVMNAGKAIKQIQTEKGITGDSLSKALGVAPQQLSRWRQSDDLKLSIIVRLCNVMGVEVSEFISAAK